MDNQTQTRRRVGNVLIFVLGLAVVTSSMVKFAGVQGVVHSMAAEGFSEGKLTLVAVLEIVSAALFLYRRTRPFGVLILSSFLGGAICTHVQMGAYAEAIGPFVLLILVWIGTWLRHPQALWSPDAGDTAGSHLVVENIPESWASKST